MVANFDLLSHLNIVLDHQDLKLQCYLLRGSNITRIPDENAWHIPVAEFKIYVKPKHAIDISHGQISERKSLAKLNRTCASIAEFPNQLLCKQICLTLSPKYFAYPLSTQVTILSHYYSAFMIRLLSSWWSLVLENPWLVNSA